MITLVFKALLTSNTYSDGITLLRKDENYRAPKKFQTSLYCRQFAFFVVTYLSGRYLMIKVNPFQQKTRTFDDFPKKLNHYSGNVFLTLSYRLPTHLGSRLRVRPSIFKAIFVYFSKIGLKVFPFLTDF